MVLVTRKERKYEDGTWSPKTLEAGPSTSNDSLHEPTHDSKEFGISNMRQVSRTIPQRKLIKETNPIWNKYPRYEIRFSGFVIFVLDLVIKLWILNSTKEEVVEGPMNQLDVGLVIKLEMFLPHTLR